MIETSSIWVVTDIDGTLMDHTYDFTPAKETINWLKELSIPVVPCTSKTAAEVKVIRDELSLRDPYIVENGGAIYGENVHGESWEIILGESYKSLEDILLNLSKEVDFDLIPLNKLSDKEAYELTGLSGNSLFLMRDRHWSMPFLNPPDNVEQRLKTLCRKYKVEIYRGNRMSHLLSENSNTGEAIKKLIDYSKNNDVEIIGLGDSPNDLPLLKSSNYKIVIPGPNGPNLKLLKELSGIDYVLAEMPHGYGWKQEVARLIKNLIKKDKK